MARFAAQPGTLLAKLSAIGRMTVAMSRATRADDIHAEALAAIHAVAGTPRAAVLLFDGAGRMRFVASRDVSEAYRAAVEGHTPWRPGEADPEPVLVPDPAAEPGLAHLLGALQAEGIRSLAMYPLVTGGGTIGKFMVYHSAPHAFGPEEVQLVRNVAAHTAFAIDRLRTVEALRQRAEELRETEARLQESQRLESLGVLAGGIAHDFNNLLMGVLGNAGIALSDLAPGAPARTALEDVVLSARRAADLTRQLLAYSGRGKFVLQRLDLSALVRESSELLGAAISRKATLRYDCCAGLPEVEGDATQLRQVAVNLLGNASDALQDRPGEITVRTGALQADRALLDRAVGGDGAVPGTFVFLEVSDGGCGMDAATVRRIFDPFFTTKFHGRGLGLAAVLGIVRGHGGAILVESVPGAGSTLRVLLPTARRAAAAVPAEPVRVRATVLLVDDEEVVRRATARMLERAGCRVVQAENGRRAVETLEGRGDVDLVLLDLTMPELSGEETLALIRARWPALPVILTSGYTPEARAAGAGPEQFLQKPYDGAALEQALRRSLEGRAPARA